MASPPQQVKMHGIVVAFVYVLFVALAVQANAAITPPAAAETLMVEPQITSMARNHLGFDGNVRVETCETERGVCKLPVRRVTFQHRLIKQISYLRARRWRMLLRQARSIWMLQD